MKKLHTILLVFATLLLSTNTFAQNQSEYNKAKNYLEKKGEVFFHFNVQTKAEINILTEIISIDNVKNLEVWAYANKKEFPKFLEKNIPYEVLPHPGDAPAEMWNGNKAIWDFDTYPTYSQYETMMNTFATTYPNLCHLDTILTLTSGRRLLVLKISDNPNTNENEPEFLYSAAMHGDETTGIVTFLRFINYLLTNYGTNSRITNLVNNIEIYICPMANPDGTYYGGNTTVTGARRENANGIDLNRNYPDPRAGQHPDGNAWQPETIAWMNFADTHDFVMAGNTHGGATVFNYPWDTWASSSKTHADDNWWQYTGNEFVDTAQIYGPAGYFTDITSTGVTEGGDWYVITGGRQDYMNYFKHCREVTIEISTSWILPANQLQNYWNYLYRSFLNYLEQSLYGVRGIITDACTGLPIKAKVFVNSHDADSSHVYSSLPIGNYHRPIYAGTYSITYSATGYTSQTITGVTVANKATVIRNIQLVPIAPIANFTADHTSGCDANIQFTDISGAPAGTTYLWNFGDGQTSTLQNPSHSYSNSGTYTVSLALTSCAGNDSEIKTSYITLTIPTAPTTTGDSICGSGTVALSATGTGTLNWYDAAIAGNLVTTGTTYSPNLTSTTTYYVESSSTTLGTSQFVPCPAITSASSSNTSRYHIFTVAAPIRLVSVQARANSTGNRTIELRTSTGTVLMDTVFNFTTTTATTINLNWDIPIGTNYQLGLSSTSTVALYRNSAGVSYPYEIAGLVSITGNSSATSYGFFYNWEVKPFTVCSSARTPVVATIGTTVTPTISISATATTICAGQSVTITATPTNGGTTPYYQWQINGTNAGPHTNTVTTTAITNNNVITCILTSSETCVTSSTATSNSIIFTVSGAMPVSSYTYSANQLAYTFTSTSTGATSYFWNFGDGNTSTLQNPTHTYATSGTYTVTLIVYNTCGSNNSFQNINAIENGISSNSLDFHLEIYPNPSNGIITIENNTSEHYQISVTDITGREVYSTIIENKINTLNISDLSDGMYYLQYSSEKGKKNVPIIIAH